MLEKAISFPLTELTGSFTNMAYFPAGNKLVKLSAVTSNTTATIPAGHMIVGVTVFNTTANAITGGVRVGTTDGGVDVVIALAIGASAVIGVPAATLLKTYFSASVDQTLYLQTVTAWNSASIDVSILIAKVI